MMDGFSNGPPLGVGIEFKLILIETFDGIDNLGSRHREASSGIVSFRLPDFSIATSCCAP
jgi:hypothetical protein